MKATVRPESTFGPAAEMTVGGDEWRQIVAALPLSGLAKELAQNCELRQLGESVCLLRLSPGHGHLQMKPAPDRLQQALGDYFGRPLRLQIEVAQNEVATPAVAVSQQRKMLQAQAASAIASDDFVQEVIGAFDASVIESSIKPIN